MINWWVIPIIFSAAFIQSSAGFGSGLIAMPLLVQVIGLATAAPAFSLLGLISGPVIMWHYRHSLKIADVTGLLVGGIVMIPFGLLLTTRVPETLMLAVLGLVILFYAVYNLAGYPVPVVSSRWGIAFGALAGLMHGAYNTGGPPLVIYGTSRRWHPFTFKSNLQSMFLVFSVFVSAGHITSGNVNQQVLDNFVLMVPAMLAGYFLGFRLDRWINPVRFRRIVLGLLVILGLSLVSKVF